MGMITQSCLIVFDLPCGNSFKRRKWPAWMRVEPYMNHRILLQLDTCLTRPVF